MTTPFGYFDLLESFAQPGCAICRLLQRDVERMLDTLLYEHTVDPATQTAFRASRGFCHDHTWMLTRYNNALGVAILYHAVIDELLSIDAPPERGSGLARLLNNAPISALADALEPKQPCPACATRDRAEAIYVQVLGEYVTDARLRAAFESSDGVCLPHFRAVLRAARSAENARLLAEVQRAKWRSLKAELELLLRKLDAHYHESIGAESTAWLRAMAQVAGERDHGK